MKKLFYMAIIALLAIAFVSCEKNNEIEQTDNNAAEIVTKTSWGLNKTWDAKLGRCARPASDCFDDVDIELGFWEKLLYWIQQANWNDPYYRYLNMSTGPEGLGDHINNNHIQAAIEGKLNASAYFNKNTNTVFLIFSDIETERTVVVYPFTLKEKE